MLPAGLIANILAPMRTAPLNWFPTGSIQVMSKVAEHVILELKEHSAMTSLFEEKCLNFSYRNMHF